MWKYTVVFLLICNQPALSRTIDLDQLMTSTAQPYVDSLRKQCNKGAGALKKVHCKSKYPTNIQFNNLSFSPGEVRESQRMDTSIPREVTTTISIVQNCTPESIVGSIIDAKRSDQISITKKDSISTAKIKTNEAIQNLETTIDRASGDLIIYPNELTSSANSISFETIDELTLRTPDSETGSSTTMVSPYSAFIIRDTVGKYRTSMDFEADIRVDSHTTNSKPFLQYSKLVPSNTVVVSGTVSNLVHKNQLIEAFQIPITQSVCQNTSSREFDLTDNYILTKPLGTLPLKETLKFSSSVSIITADVISNVQVRVRHLGVGSCKAQLISNFTTQGIYVPESNWSQWEIVLNPFGQTVYNLSTQHDCPSTFEAEIRYFK